MNEPPRKPNSTDTFVLDTYDSRVQEFSTGPAQPPPRPTPQPLEDPAALHPYSHAFYRALIRAHPEWEPLARLIPTDNGYVMSLFMELQAPSPSLADLWISTEDFEVTVGFGNQFHTHFATYEPETDETVYERAIRFVDDFIQEKLVLVVGMCGDRSGGSWVQPAQETPRVAEWFVPWTPYDRLVVLSWNSTFDRETAG